MELNLTALQKLLKSTNTSYKFLYFYSLIKIIKKNNFRKKITFKEILNEMIITAWLPCFQFNLNFRKQDKMKSFLIEFTKNSQEKIKENKPTNKIIEKIKKEINTILSEEKNYQNLKKKILEKYVLIRLVRPFYKRLINKAESGERGIDKIGIKILKNDYKKEQPPYLINFEKSEIILNRKWSRYIQNHFSFLELWVLDEWYKYMQHQNINSPNLYEKLKFPQFKRISLDKQRILWKKIIDQNEVKCIFSKQILTNSNFEIDHFICWNFLNHDQEWNLIPVLNEINRSKNNKIPKQNLIKDLVDLKIKSFNYARSILSPIEYNKYLVEHSNFINFSHDQCFTPNFKNKYNEEINSLANKAKNQGFEEFNGR